jgi:hypothetical protein
MEEGQVPQCELLKTCKFFSGNMSNMPNTSELLKAKYCEGDNSRCARYLVFKSLGRQHVPSDLFPHDEARAVLVVAATSSRSSAPPVRQWSVSDGDLKDLDARKALDLITRCFFEVQKERLAKAEKRLNVSSGESGTRAAVRDIVLDSFRRLDLDYEHPTKEALAKVAADLAATSRSLGTPEDTVQHHLQQIQKILHAF